MSQFTLPGVLKQNTGADFRGTAGIHISLSGGVATKPVAYSELAESLAAEAQARIAQIQALPVGLTENEVETRISQAVAEAVAGIFRLKGEHAGDGTALPASPAVGDTYRVTSAGSVFGFPADLGDLVYYTDTGWKKIDNVDPAISGVAGNPLSVVRTGDNSYTVSLTTAFIDRVAAAELAIQTEASNRAAADAALQLAIDTEAATRQADIEAEATRAQLAEQGLQTSADNLLSYLQTEITDREALGTSLRAEVAAVDAEKVDISRMVDTIINVLSQFKKVEDLVNGVYDAALGTTKFYVPGFSSSLDFNVSLIGESAAPYEDILKPQVAYYPHSGLPAAVRGSLDSNLSYAEVTFYDTAQVANGLYTVYCDRYPSTASLTALVQSSYDATAPNTGS